MMCQIFISHAERDGQVARDLCTELEKAGFKVWFYERDSLPGATYISQVAEALRGCQAVVVVVSPESLKSNQVTNEIVRAYEGNKHFMPVLYGITHEEYRKARDDWRQCFGASTSIGIPEQGVAAIVPRIARGLEHLGIKPGEAPKPPEPKPTPVRVAEPTRPEPKPEPAKPGPKHEPVAKPTSVAPRPERRPPTSRRKLSPWLWAAIAAGGVLVIGTALVLALRPRPAVKRWVRTFGSSGYDEGQSVLQTFDGRYITAGKAWTKASGFQILLLETDARGDSTRAWMLGGNGQGYGRSVVQLNDSSGYVVAGAGAPAVNGAPCPYTDVFLIRTDADGDTVWSRMFGDSHVDGGFSVQQTKDGGYIVAGHTRSFKQQSYDFDVYLVKVRPDGTKDWDTTFGASARPDMGYSVQQVWDRGYIVTGFTTTDSTGEDVYLVKTNEYGKDAREWTVPLPGEQRGWSVQVTRDSGYIVAGSTEIDSTDEDVYLAKFDRNGAVVWDTTFGGAGEDRGFAVQQTKDGGYVIAGLTTSFGAGGYDVYLVKTDSVGAKTWERQYGDRLDEEGRAVQQTKDDGYIIAGSSRSYGSNMQVYLVKTDADGKVD